MPFSVTLSAFRLHAQVPVRLYYRRDRLYGDPSDHQLSGTIIIGSLEKHPSDAFSLPLLFYKEQSDLPGRKKGKDPCHLLFFKGSEKGDPPSPDHGKDLFIFDKILEFSHAFPVYIEAPCPPQTPPTPDARPEEFPVRSVF